MATTNTWISGIPTYSSDMATYGNYQHVDRTGQPMATTNTWISGIPTYPSDMATYGNYQHVDKWYTDLFI